MKNELKVVSVETETCLKIKVKEKGYYGPEYQRCIERGKIQWYKGWSIAMGNDKASQLEAAYQRFLGNKSSEIIEQSKNLGKSVGL